MSYPEAKADGIPIEEKPHRTTLYYPPCRFCGTPVRSWSYQRNVRYACPACRKEAVAQERAEAALAAATGKEKKLEMAIKRISKVADITLYTDAIEAVRKQLKQPGWFQSTEEIMVALELLRQGVKTHHQVKVYDYSIDFVLPDMRVALEIDGLPYHGKERQKYQETRDDVLKWRLGKDWEIIHIRTDNINLNVTRLLPGIRVVLAERKKCAHEFT